jgi:hypothetical protein
MAFADIVIENAWVRATTGTNKVSAGYAAIVNTGPQADQLQSVSTPIAMMTEVHESKATNGVMSMEPVDTLTVPANGRVELKPGSYHLMIMNVTQPLKVGDMVDVTFNFKIKGAVTVKAKVLPLAATKFE